MLTTTTTTPPTTTGQGSDGGRQRVELSLTLQCILCSFAVNPGNYWFK
jgi:hypothetical protein